MATRLWGELTIWRAEEEFLDVFGGFRGLDKS